MDYIHYFDTETNHNSVYNGSNYTEPWVAYIKENEKITYNDRRPYLIGTAAKEFKPTEGAFSGYTFTSPTFKVIYTGDTLTDLSHAFYNQKLLKSITQSTLDTSNVTDMHEIFNFCTNLTNISGLSNWNTSNVTDMNSMFYYCSSIKTLNLSSWNTSNVTKMIYMFYGCSSLTTLDISHFDTSKVTNMGFMFHGCPYLTTVKVTNCSSGETGTQQKILTQLKNDLPDYTWTLTDGVITRS